MKTRIMPCHTLLFVSITTALSVFVCKTALAGHKDWIEIFSPFDHCQRAFIAVGNCIKEEKETGYQYHGTLITKAVIGWMTTRVILQMYSQCVVVTLPDKGIQVPRSFLEPVLKRKDFAFLLDTSPSLPATN